MESVRARRNRWKDCRCRRDRSRAKLLSPCGSWNVSLLSSDLSSLNFGGVDDGFGKGLRGFLRQIVPDAALDGPMRIFAGKFTGVGARLRMRGAVGVTFHGDGGHGNHRSCGEPLVDIGIFGLAFGEPEPPAIIMDDNRDVIRIVEGRGAAVERGIVEVPFRRSEPPNELGKVVPVFVVAVPAAIRGKIKLVP